MSSFLLCSYYSLVNTDYLKFRLQELQLFDVRRVKKINYIVFLIGFYYVSTLYCDIQGVIESCTDILTTSYWLRVELEKNI
jgi:hypothetical protein